MKILGTVVVMGFLILAPVQGMADDHAHKLYVGSDAFESMKRLVGSWQAPSTWDKARKPSRPVTISPPPAVLSSKLFLRGHRTR